MAWVSGRPEMSADESETGGASELVARYVDKIKAKYDRFRERHDDRYFLSPEDSLPTGQALGEALTEILTRGVGTADGNVLVNRVSDIMVPDVLSPDQVRQAVLLAGRHRGYELTGESGDRLVFQLEARGKVAEYTIVFEDDVLAMYSNSYRKHDPEDQIENKGWTANLEQTIKVYLDRQVERMTNYDEIVGDDPDGFGALIVGDPVEMFSVPDSFTPGETQEMIVRGAEAKGYSIVARDAGLVVARLKDGGATAEYIFHYVGTEVRMHSRVYKTRNPRKIFEKPRWSEGLKAAILKHISIRTS